MKKAIFFLTLLLGTIFTISGTVSAAAGGPFSTAARVANLSGSPATCVFAFYDANGTLSHSINLDPIPAGDSALVFTPQVAGLAAGQYSSVISCDQEVAAVVNFSDIDSGASYNGADGAALSATLYNPTVYKNYFDFLSESIVQNTTSSPIDITVEIFAPGSATPVSTQNATSVPAFASVVFDHSTDANLSNGTAYSAVITGTGDMAAVINIWGQGAVAAQLYSYNAFSSGSTTNVYTPVIMNAYFSFNTAITIQNIDSTAANITITYGTGLTENATIQPGSSAVFYTPDRNISVGTLTSATITSNNNAEIVAIVNESSNANRAASYVGFTSGSTSVAVPIVMRTYFDYNSSVTCQNIGTSSANITIAYSNGASETVNSVGANASALFYQGNYAGIANGSILNATITSAEPIVCVVNQDQNEGALGTQNMDQLFSYEGIGQ